MEPSFASHHIDELRDYRANHLRRGCPRAARVEGRRYCIHTERHDSEGVTGGIRAVHLGRRYIPQKIAAELAEHYAEDDLSEREIEVLREVAHGTSNKIIASHLSISEETVKAHMKNILLKLGASDRTHAVSIATTRGYLI